MKNFKKIIFQLNYVSMKCLRKTDYILYLCWHLSNYLLMIPENIKKYFYGNKAVDVKYHKAFISSSLKERKLRLGFVTSWRVKCGIAEYSRFLIQEIKNPAIIFACKKEFRQTELIYESENNIKFIRCWQSHKDDLENLYQEIIFHQINIVHIQFNFGFFNLLALANLIKKLSLLGIKIIITFHSTQDVKSNRKNIFLSQIKKELSEIDQNIVHTLQDYQKLSQLGLKNISKITQGCKLVKNKNKFNLRQQKNIDNSFIISTFGFLLPHKGVIESIESINILKNSFPDILFYIICALYPHPASQQYFTECQMQVKKFNLERNIEFFPIFLEENKIIELLQLSDIIIMPYKNTQESSSAAVRTALSSSRPVITTDIPIFNEFTDQTYKISHCQPIEIANGIKNLWLNPDLQQALILKSAEFMALNSWKNIAAQHIKIYESLIK